jgi:hypothetical protein
MFLFTRGKHLHDWMISVKGKFGTQNASLTLSCVIGVPVPSKESELWYTWVLGVSICFFLQFVVWIMKLFRNWYFFHFIEQYNKSQIGQRK